MSTKKLLFYIIVSLLLLNIVYHIGYNNGYKTGHNVGYISGYIDEKALSSNNTSDAFYDKLSQEEAKMRSMQGKDASDTDETFRYEYAKMRSMQKNNTSENLEY
jgi:hypothetical protein